MRNRVCAGAALTAIVGLVLLAGPASAHVTVTPSEAEQGSYTTLSFRVPTESDTLSTTGLTVQLPRDHPFASVRVKPHAGWTYRVERTKLARSDTDDAATEAVSTITWSAAQGGGIGPGESDEFEIAVGPLPDVVSLTFKTLQRYSDGTLVRWIEETAEGQPEPVHQAPMLRLEPAGGEAAHGPITSLSASTPSSGAAPAHTAAKSSTDRRAAALVISLAALVVVAAALGAARVRRRVDQG